MRGAGVDPACSQGPPVPPQGPRTRDGAGEQSVGYKLRTRSQTRPQTSVVSSHSVSEQRANGREALFTQQHTHVRKPQEVLF